jgi:hypothetical protein
MRKLSSGKCSGIKRPFKLEEIWRIRTRLELENDLMQLALLNLAIDSKLRASDLLKLNVYDVSSQGVIYERVQCIQQKTGTDVHYEITPRTQQSISRWVYSAHLEASSFYFQAVAVKAKPSAIRFIVRLSGTGL